MERRVSRDGDVVVLAPDGNLAAAEDTSALETRLAALPAAGVRRLVVDCTAVGRLTGAAIRPLLLTSRKLARAQGPLMLFGMNAKVHKAFAIAGFDRDFSVVEPAADALPAARGAARR